ncbi:MAG: cupin domain-containing protein [Hyphomonadaceae bacterium]|nr:cupin domain-containing protein [Hyphomonadaceae bacterium]
MKWAALIIAALAAGCVSISVDESIVRAAAENPRVRSCPAERTQANAHSEGFGATSGVTVTDVALTPLAHDPARAARLRRIAVQPGGVIAWHDHTAVQGYAVLIAGEMVELRNTCRDPIIYRAGDVTIEDAQTAHSWRNESDETAIVPVSHVVTR